MSCKESMIGELRIRESYMALQEVLHDAYNQAAVGKGADRHACHDNFDKQIICEVTRRLQGSPVGGPLFQAVKKIYETTRTDPIPELLGAINYIAAAIIVLREIEYNRAKAD